MNNVIESMMANALRDGARLHAELPRACGEEILEASRLWASCLRTGNKILFFGNGGSAADAQHLAAELVGRFVADRVPLPGLALTVDSSTLTSIGNDYGFDHIFSRQIRALGAPGDVAVAISTSGRSPNILEGVKAARERGMKVVGLTGRKGDPFAKLCDVGIVVPSSVTSRIQECHIAIGHILCETTEAVLFTQGASPSPAPEEPRARPRVTGSPKELDLSTLLALRSLWKKNGQTVVWTNGVFDLLHAGHLASLKAARALGDVLVVGVNCDETVRKAKGDGRPIFGVAERVELLSGLETVDHVVVFDEPTPVEILLLVRPDVHCKGADYAPPHGAPIPEAAIVESYGGRIAFLPLIPDRSSSRTLARLLREA